MTNEEAISALKNTAWIGTDKKVGEVEKAIMMAIEVLKAQNVTDTNVGNNDLISRSDAIDAVDKLSDEPIGYLEAAIDALVDLPSAQPEIKPVDIDYYYCSNAMLKMWIDNVLTDGEYNKIMDKLNDFERRRQEKENG